MKTITILITDCKYFEDVEEEGYGGNCNSPDFVGECGTEWGCPINKEESQ